MTSRAVIVRLLNGAAVLLAAWWAFGPLERRDLRLPAPPAVSPDGTSAPATLIALDDSAFRAPLWVAPPPPPPAPVEAKPAPLPPLKLQLLAIVRQDRPVEGGDGSLEYKALLYDPDTDKLLEVAAGQTIGDRTVIGVTQREITLKDRAGTRTLSLRDETRAAPGGGS